MADRNEDQSRIFVIGLDMENRPAEDIARDAANQIAALFDRLVAERDAKGKADLKEEGS